MSTEAAPRNPGVVADEHLGFNARLGALVTRKDSSPGCTSSRAPRSTYSIRFAIRLVFTLAWNRYAQRLTRWLARLGHVAPVSFTWGTSAGPLFGNHLAMKSPSVGEAAACSRS